MDCSCGNRNNYTQSRMNQQGRMGVPGSNCGCNTQNPPSDGVCTNSREGLDDAVVGMGYVPWQQWCGVSDPDKGLQEGTIFQEMIYPFYGCIPSGYFNNGKCQRGGRYV